jgi:hypothetical protein
MERINPGDIAKPVSNYAQGVLHGAGAQRLVISGQVGVRPDGSIEEGLEAQLARAWSNVFGVLKAAGFEAPSGEGDDSRDGARGSFRVQDGARPRARRPRLCIDISAGGRARLA